jgi:hypothetical protein
LFQLNMTPAEIAATGAPAWERAIMTAMARYGMYVNDTNGSGGGQTLELEKMSDISYTSLGQPAMLGNLLKRLGGTYWGPGNYWSVWGTPIPVSKLRVIDPCVDQGTCPSPPNGAQASSRRGLTSRTDLGSGARKHKTKRHPRHHRRRHRRHRNHHHRRHHRRHVAD